MDQGSELDSLREQVRALRGALRYSTAYLGAAVSRGYLEECAIPVSSALRRLAPLANATPEELRAFLERQAALEQAGRAVLELDAANGAVAAVREAAPSVSYSSRWDSLLTKQEDARVAHTRAAVILRTVGFDAEGGNDSGS